MRSWLTKEPESTASGALDVQQEDRLPESSPRVDVDAETLKDLESLDMDTDVSSVRSMSPASEGTFKTPPARSLFNGSGSARAEKGIIDS